MPGTAISGRCVEVAPAPVSLVLFGASGDLAKRKLFPSLYQLFRANLLHPDSRIGCCLRNADGFREKVRNALPAAAPDCRDAFLELLDPVVGDYRSEEFFAALAEFLRETDRSASALPRNRLFYLAVPPDACAGTVEGLSRAGLLAEPEGGPWRHVILEKPFGRDLESAQALDDFLHRHLKEEQIYRIDHYLGKETVQNIAILRFANPIFEPVWDCRSIDHVQITLAEEIGVETRANYFEQSGFLRDMFQNHMLEMLSLAAMEKPETFAADAVRDEQRKVVDAVRRFPAETAARDLVRAQYTAGGGMPGYREEPGVDPASQVETYVAARFFIDNARWRDVPFYVRGGKRLTAKKTEIAITFKRPEQSIFAPLRTEDFAPDTLVMHVQPEGMDLTLQAKHPGPRLCMGPMTLHFHYDELGTSAVTDAYARLLLDAMLGDPTLFMRSDLIRSGWELFTPVLDAWRDRPETSPLHFYPAGSDGPAAADDLLRKDGRCWRPLR